MSHSYIIMIHSYIEMLHFYIKMSHKKAHKYIYFAFLNIDVAFLYRDTHSYIHRDVISYKVTLYSYKYLDVSNSYIEVSRFYVDISK